MSSSALDALSEFYAERDERQKRFEEIKAVVEERTLSIEDFAEDWNESQFWVLLHCWELFRGPA